MEEQRTPSSSGSENKAVKVLAFGTIGLILLSLILLVVMGARAGVF